MHSYNHCRENRTPADPAQNPEINVGTGTVDRARWGHVVERFLADLRAMYPQTRGVIAGATVQRWQYGNVYAQPGRGRLQGALEGALGAHENLHLAGDYFAELGTMEAAARKGLVAAERVDALSGGPGGRQSPGNSKEVSHV